MILFYFLCMILPLSGQNNPGRYEAVCLLFLLSSYVRYVWVLGLGSEGDGEEDPRGVVGSPRHCFIPQPAFALIENYFLAKLLLSAVIK